MGSIANQEHKTGVIAPVARNGRRKYYEACSLRPRGQALALIDVDRFLSELLGAALTHLHVASTV
jgi:hypothetical protein